MKFRARRKTSERANESRKNCFVSCLSKFMARIGRTTLPRIFRARDAFFGNCCWWFSRDIVREGSRSRRDKVEPCHHMPLTFPEQQNVRPRLRRLFPAGARIMYVYAIQQRTDCFQGSLLETSMRFAASGSNDILSD